MNLSGKSSTIWVVFKQHPTGITNVRAYKSRDRAQRYADMRTRQAKAQAVKDGCPLEYDVYSVQPLGLFDGSEKGSQNGN